MNPDYCLIIEQMSGNIVTTIFSKNTKGGEFFGKIWKHQCMMCFQWKLQMWAIINFELSHYSFCLRAKAVTLPTNRILAGNHTRGSRGLRASLTWPVPVLRGGALSLTSYTYIPFLVFFHLHLCLLFTVFFLRSFVRPSLLSISSVSTR